MLLLRTATAFWTLAGSCNVPTQENGVADNMPVDEDNEPCTVTPEEDKNERPVEEDSDSIRTKAVRPTVIDEAEDDEEQQSRFVSIVTMRLVRVMNEIRYVAHRLRLPGLARRLIPERFRSSPKDAPVLTMGPRDLNTGFPVTRIRFTDENIVNNTTSPMRLSMYCGMAWASCTIIARKVRNFTAKRQATPVRTKPCTSSRVQVGDKSKTVHQAAAAVRFYSELGKMFSELEQHLDVVSSSPKRSSGLSPPPRIVSPRGFKRFSGRLGDAASNEACSRKELSHTPRRPSKVTSQRARSRKEESRHV